jgi:hypothetical protein
LWSAWQFERESTRRSGLANLNASQASMHMGETAPDNAAVENAYRDIDRYVAETAKPTNDGQLLSPSQRLRVLGMQKAGSSKPSAAQDRDSAVNE